MDFGQMLERLECRDELQVCWKVDYSLAALGLLPVVDAVGFHSHLDPIPEEIKGNTPLLGNKKKARLDPRIERIWFFDGPFPAET